MRKIIKFGGYELRLFIGIDAIFI